MSKRSRIFWSTAIICVTVFIALILYYNPANPVAWFVAVPVILCNIFFYLPAAIGLIRIDPPARPTCPHCGKAL